MSKESVPSAKTQVNGEYAQRIDRVIDYLRGNLDRPLNFACFSEFHFHRIFRAVSGETLNNFTNRLRVEKAAFFAPRVALCLFGAAACGIALLRTGAASGLLFCAVFLIGLGMGAEVDIIAYVVSRYFGLRAFGEIYGYAFASYVLAGALGPWLMALGFDRSGSYGSALLGFFLATLLAVVLMTRLGPYRFRPG